jgi:hypothetical protein
VSADPPEPTQERVFVITPPHEYFALSEMRDAEPSAYFGRTICICAEQPDTAHFDANARYSRAAAATLDISPVAVEEFRRLGIPAERFQIGATDVWKPAGGVAEGPPRDLDVLFMGCESPRRSHHLASYADALCHWDHRLIVSDNGQPNYQAAPNFVIGEQKWQLLRRSKVMLNLHVGERPYFEWLRAAQAMVNGCVVVSERSEGAAPLVPGVHYVSGHAEVLHHMAAGVLADDALRQGLAGAAIECLEAAPLSAAVERLAGIAADIARRPLRRQSAALPQRDTSNGSPTRPAAPDARAGPAALAAFAGGPAVDGVRVEGRSESYGGARPGVSVVLAAGGMDSAAEASLGSVAGHPDAEVVIAVEGSAEGAAQRALDWVRSSPRVPAVVVHGTLRQGLEFARSPYVLPLEPDVTLLPGGLNRLVTALEGEPSRGFAYGMLAEQDEHGQSRLSTRSMGLFRAEALGAAAGLETNGSGGMLVPQLVGRRRRRADRGVEVDPLAPPLTVR